MEEQKYFIPEIEDIRIGYEFELIDYASNNYNSDKSTCNWNSYVLEKKDIFSSYKEESFLETCICYLNSKHLRVSYLTKEQIKAEGWEFIKQINNKLYFKNKTFVLTFEDNYINLDNVEGIDIGYWGQCKDINTFRYICKLLEI